jgi:hypothetical protein
MSEQQQAYEELERAARDLCECMYRLGDDLNLASAGTVVALKLGPVQNALDRLREGSGR